MNGTRKALGSNQCYPVAQEESLQIALNVLLLFLAKNMEEISTIQGPDSKKKKYFSSVRFSSEFNLINGLGID